MSSIIWLKTSCQSAENPAFLKRLTDTSFSLWSSHIITYLLFLPTSIIWYIRPRLPTDGLLAPITPLNIAKLLALRGMKKRKRKNGYVAKLDHLEMTTKLNSLKKEITPKKKIVTRQDSNALASLACEQILTKNVLLAALFSIWFSSSEVMLTARKSYQKYKKPSGSAE